MSDYILCEIQNRIARVTVNRPESLNALNEDVLRDLLAAAERISAADVRAIILTGAGERAFVAGADIAYMQSLDERGAERFSRMGQNLFRRIEEMPAIVIAAVNGFALGGGCELAAACDIRVAVRSAAFGIPEVTLGLIPCFGGSWRLPRLLGDGIAKELLATGRKMSAEEALSRGFLNHVVENTDELADCCDRLAASIAANGANAVRMGKRCMNVNRREGLMAETLESELFAKAFSSDEAREGISAFLEKRIPRF